MAVRFMTVGDDGIGTNKMPSSQSNVMDEKQSQRGLRFLRTLMVFFLMNCAFAGAQTSVLWEIGRHDRSAREFPKGARTQLRYDVRTSDWKKDWAATQSCGAQYDIAFD